MFWQYFMKEHFIVRASILDEVQAKSVILVDNKHTKLQKCIDQNHNKLNYDKPLFNCDNPHSELGLFTFLDALQDMKNQLFTSIMCHDSAEMRSHLAKMFQFFFQTQLFLFIFTAIIVLIISYKKMSLVLKKTQYSLRYLGVKFGDILFIFLQWTP